MTADCVKEKQKNALLTLVNIGSGNNSKGSKQILEDPSIEIHYKFSNFGDPLGPQVEFHEGHIGFSGALSPKPPRLFIQTRDVIKS